MLVPLRRANLSSRTLRQPRSSFVQLILRIFSARFAIKRFPAREQVKNYECTVYAKKKLQDKDVRE